MKYYSEVTKKIYDSVNELKEAEAKATEKANARKLDAEKVEKAFNDYRDAKAAYEKTLKDFCDKYGSYHRTITSEAIGTSSTGSLRELVNLLFD